jgi:hypothetical protein
LVIDIGFEIKPIPFCGIKLERAGGIAAVDHHEFTMEKSIL